MQSTLLAFVLLVGVCNSGLGKHATCFPTRKSAQREARKTGNCLLLIQEVARLFCSNLVIKISHVNGDGCHLVADCVPSFVLSAGQKARQALAGKSSRRFLGGRPNPTAFDSISQSRKTSFLSRHLTIASTLHTPLRPTSTSIFVASVRSTHRTHTHS